MTDDEWAAAAEAQRVYNSWCPHCRRDKFGPNACKCPGSTMFFLDNGTLDIGDLPEPPSTNSTNSFHIFFEEFTSVTEVDGIITTIEPEDTP